MEDGGGALVIIVKALVGILEQYGLIGLVVGALGWIAWVFYNKSENKSEKQVDTLLTIIKENTASNMTVAAALQSNTSAIKDVQNVLMRGKPE